MHLILKSPFASTVDGIGLTTRGPLGLNRPILKGTIYVNVCGWKLYAYVKESVYKSQLRGWSATYIRSATKIVLLYRSTYPFVLGTVRVCDVFRDVHDVANVLEELRCETASVICYAFLQRAIVE